MHVSLFPNHRGLSQYDMDELKDVFNYGLFGECGFLQFLAADS